MPSDLLPPNKPFEFEARYPHPGYKRLKSGDIYTLNVEILEEAWDLLKTVPDDAILHIVMWYGDGDPVEQPKNEKVEKPLAGPFSRYWQKMFANGWDCDLGLLEVLDVEEPKQVKAAAYTVFQVDTMADVAPVEFETWCTEHELHSLVMMSRLVQAKLQEKR